MLSASLGYAFIVTFKLQKQNYEFEMQVKIQ